MSIKTTIPNRGSGIRKIVPIEKSNGMTSEDIYNEEEYKDTPEVKKGDKRYNRDELSMDPLQILYLNVDILKNCKYIFFVEVESKPKDTSTNAKLMFREELRDLQGMMQMGATVNIEELQNSYAQIWHRRKEKLFSKPQQMQAQNAADKGSNTLNENIPALQPDGMAGQLA